jgi:hypothetical protein
MTLRPAGDPDAAVAVLIDDVVDNVASLPVETELTAIVERCLDDDQDWLVLVDTAGHPVRLVERAAMLRCEPFEHTVTTVAIGQPLDSVARRAVARAPVDRLRPLVGCDAEGRYVGLLRVERLLAALVA